MWFYLFNVLSTFSHHVTLQCTVVLLICRLGTIILQCNVRLYNNNNNNNNNNNYYYYYYYYKGTSWLVMHPPCEFSAVVWRLIVLDVPFLSFCIACQVTIIIGHSVINGHCNRFCYLLTLVFIRKVRSVVHLQTLVLWPCLYRVWDLVESEFGLQIPVVECRRFSDGDHPWTVCPALSSVVQLYRISGQCRAWFMVTRNTFQAHK